MMTLARVALVAGTLVICALANAQGFPSRPIRMIVPYAPGGNVDISARIIGPGMGELLGQTIIVENRPGGGGNVGAGLVAKATPDGHTLLVGSSGPLSVNPVVFKDIPYDSVKDFAPVSLVQIVPLVLLVSPKFTVGSVKELLDRAKAQPGKITIASAGTGTTNHFAIELFSAMTGAKLLHVPYKGSGPALSELLGGQVNTMIDQLTSSMGFIKDGKLKVIAVTAAKRVSALPNVPTLAESGVPNYEASTFLGILAPAGTPRALIAKLNAALRKVMDTPAVQERFRGLGADPGGSTPEQFARMIRDELNKWRSLAQRAKLEFN
ncbi:MAG TPA: tripartite tricarboxylate transporter substrate binding protein [Burkholderiales bacterium]|jgi:tripartite-type tricarboxylate transporter receptor subunit TctC|nr:tripartite tricarboxylate transporter substrate binding protein [Burkholderiales bacterium]